MGNLRAEIGDLQFAEPSTSPIIKYLVPFCAALLVVVMVIGFVYYKRRALRRRWFKLKAMPGEPNVHYASQGAHPDSAVQRGERREGVDESRTVNENCTPSWICVIRICSHRVTPVLTIYNISIIHVIL